ncbi:MAG: hypothetical protein IT290_01880, partial [Deltaproteobacteria bacterium]|nr:hypothetical protein [Deltaproteobacteria bacterium]
ARIPADVPFTFQTLDRDGLALNMSQTWHQVRPGEDRHDCGGCHAHANRPTDFALTAAGQPGYQVPDVVNYLSLLSKNSAGDPSVSVYTGAARKTHMDVEYQRDIKPIFQRSCAGCHSGATPAGSLDLSATPENGWDRAYNCLARDQSANCGYKPVIPARVWRQTNASRWVRMFQARRSLLIWKIFGRRLDGWLNSDHPTESVLGDASTLPPGADPDLADIDYTGTIMPPPGSGYQALSEDEKMMIARWVDLGMPSNRPNGSEPQANWFVDELRPTLHVSWPPARRISSLNTLQFVAHDYYSGLDTNSLVVTADFPVNGKAPGVNLAQDFGSTGEGRWGLNLTTPITNLARGVVSIQIADTTGNIARQSVTFQVDPAGIDPTPPGDPFGPGGPPTPTPDEPIRIKLPRAPLKLRLKRVGGALSVTKAISLQIENVSLPALSRISLRTSGKGATISGGKKDLRMKSRVKIPITIQFKKAGSYVLRFSVKHPRGTTKETLSVVVAPPR